MGFVSVKMFFCGDLNDGILLVVCDFEVCRNVY